jgi:hypothetical protein
MTDSCGDQPTYDRHAQSASDNGLVSMGDVLTRRQRARLKTGDVLLGRYKILGELGQGGMGLVFRCLDEVSGIEVAVKILPPEVSRDSGEMEEVRENFQLVSRLAHPNIATVRTLEKDPDTGEYLLVMDCVNGVNMRQWRKRRSEDGGQRSVQEILPLIQQIAAALDYAHSQKVIHRDIKPSNVMITSEGTVKVLDFGLAAQIQSSFSRVSQVRYGTSGTGPYMAPEQWQGQYQDAKTDQYALGVLVYELLAGRCPFESHDPAVLREAVLHEPPPAIPGLPAHVGAALARALVKDRKSRYENCQAYYHELKKCEATLPVFGSFNWGKIFRGMLENMTSMPRQIKVMVGHYGVRFCRIVSFGRTSCHGKRLTVFYVCIAVVTGVLYGLSLISYSPGDIIFIQDPPNYPIKNYLGVLGAWIGFVFFGLYGLAAFVLPLFMVFLYLIVKWLPVGKACLASGTLLASLLIKLDLMHGPLAHITSDLSLVSAGGYIGFIFTSCPWFRGEVYLGLSSCLLIYGVYILVSSERSEDTSPNIDSSKSVSVSNVSEGQESVNCSYIDWGKQETTATGSIFQDRLYMRRMAMIMAIIFIPLFVVFAVVQISIIDIHSNSALFTFMFFANSLVLSVVGNASATFSFCSFIRKYRVRRLWTLLLLILNPILFNASLLLGAASYDEVLVGWMLLSPVVFGLVGWVLAMTFVVKRVCHACVKRIRKMLSKGASVTHAELDNT